MAFSKSNLYNPEDQLTSLFARALGHPARLAILRKIHLGGPMCVEIIAEGHPICEETISEHLKILRVNQLVEWEEKYPYTFYALHKNNMKIAIEMLSHFLGEFGERD